MIIPFTIINMEGPFRDPKRGRGGGRKGSTYLRPLLSSFTKVYRVQSASYLNLFDTTRVESGSDETWMIWFTWVSSAN